MGLKNKEYLYFAREKKVFREREKMCDSASDSSVRSINLYGSAIPANLDAWADVETLNLCFAGIKKLDSITQLPNLRRLYLRHNSIDSFDEIRKLKMLPNLTSLSLIGNEICKHPEYRSEVLSMLPELTILDGEILDEGKMELESDKESPEELCADEPESGTRKPQIVAALSLLIGELETLEDIQELQKELRNRSAKIKETNADVFTV